MYIVCCIPVRSHRWPFMADASASGCHAPRSDGWDVQSDCLCDGVDPFGVWSRGHCLRSGFVIHLHYESPSLYHIFTMPYTRVRACGPGSFGRHSSCVTGSHELHHQPHCKYHPIRNALYIICTFYRNKWRDFYSRVEWVVIMQLWCVACNVYYNKLRVGRIRVSWTIAQLEHNFVVRLISDAIMSPSSQNRLCRIMA